MRIIQRLALRRAMVTCLALSALAGVVNPGECWAAPPETVSLVLVPGGAGVLASGEGAIWVGPRGGQRKIHRIEHGTRSAKVAASTRYVAGLAAGFGRVWIAPGASAGRGLLSFAPPRGAIVAEDAAPVPFWVEAGLGGVWFAGQCAPAEGSDACRNDVLARRSRGGARLTVSLDADTSAAPRAVAGLALGGRGVWAALASQDPADTTTPDVLVRVDVLTGRASAPRALPRAPRPRPLARVRANLSVDANGSAWIDTTDGLYRARRDGPPRRVRPCLERRCLHEDSLAAGQRVWLVRRAVRGITVARLDARSARQQGPTCTVYRGAGRLTVFPNASAGMIIGAGALWISTARGVVRVPLAWPGSGRRCPPLNPSAGTGSPSPPNPER